MELRHDPNKDTATTITLEWTPVPGAQGYRFSSSDTVKRSHTWDPMRSSVRFSKGADWYRVEALEVIEDGEWPAPEPPPPPPPPATKPLFDGRAKLVDSMRGTTYGQPYGTGAYMNPRIYNEDIATYYEDDISLLADARFGKVFRVGLNERSRNPGWVGQPASKPSAEITERRPIAIGQVDWYAVSLKFQAGWKAGDWGVVVQLGYPTLTSPPLAVAISLKSGVAKVGIDRHAGTVTSGTTGLTNVEARFHDLTDVQGKWLDFLIGVQWDPKANGWVRVETRPEGSGWGVRYEAHDTPTWQQKSGDGPKATVMDKMGAYQDASHLTGSWENVVLHSGITRWADEASARASLG